MNHAARHVTPSIRCSWWALMPFLDAESRWMAVSHFDSGTCDDSKIVPVVLENWR